MIDSLLVWLKYLISKTRFGFVKFLVISALNEDLLDEKVTVHFMGVTDVGEMLDNLDPNFIYFFAFGYLSIVDQHFWTEAQMTFL